MNNKIKEGIKTKCPNCEGHRISTSKKVNTIFVDGKSIFIQWCLDCHTEWEIR